MSDNLPAPAPEDSGEFLLYQTEDGQTRIDVRLAHETIWLSQRLIADLFQVSVKTANEHLVNIYHDGELDPLATIRKFRIVQPEGTRKVSRVVDHYNLDAILAVGYRDEHFAQSLDELKKTESQAKEAKKKFPGKQTPRKKAATQPNGNRRSND